jgi:hypothetical protein
LINVINLPEGFFLSVFLFVFDNFLIVTLAGVEISTFFLFYKYFAM